MQLSQVSYTQFPNDPREWILEPVDLQQINLIVGRNASGKSRTLNIINALANLISGRSTSLPVSAEFDAFFSHGDMEWNYELRIENRLVVLEQLSRGDEVLLDRRDNGEGTIYSEQLSLATRFQAPQSSLAVFARQDTVQHSYLQNLVDWATGTFFYPFGRDLGQGSLSALVPGGPPANIYDPNQTAGVFRAGKREFGDRYLSELLADMREVGYP